MRKDSHHKKLDNKVPPWLWFALNDLKGKPKTLDIKEIETNVLFALKEHYAKRKELGQEIELEPNNYDCAGMYGQKYENKR